MAANDVQIQIIGRDMASTAFKSVENAAQRTAQSVSSFGSAMSATNRILTTTVGTMAGIAGINGLESIFNKTVGASMKFAKSMEVSEVGIAGILLSMTQVNDRSLEWGESIAMSKNIMKQLSDEALRTAATTEELTMAFQGILGPALNAKMTISEIVQLSSAGVNAVKTLLPGNADMKRQIVQELRDLVAGGIQPASSTLATALGLKDEDIKKAKESSEGLFKFLMDRMKGFEMAAPAYARTWQGITDQLKEGVTRAGATGLEPLFAAVKEQMAGLSGYVTTVNQETKKIELNPAVVEGFRSVAESTLWIGRNAKEITAVLAGWMVVGKLTAIYADITAVTAGATAAQTMLGRAVLSVTTAHSQQVATAQAAAAAEISAAVGANAAILAAIKQREAASANAAVVAAGAASLEQAGLFASAATLKGLQAEYVKLGATAEQAGVMQVQAAKLAKDGNFLLALQLMAVQEGHLKAGAAAGAAGSATLTAMGTAGGAVKNLLGTVWALAGGWFGVAAAIGFAIYKLYDYYDAKANFDNDKPIIEKDAAGNERYYKNIVVDRPVEVQGEGIVTYQKGLEKVELSEEEIRRYLEPRIAKRKMEMGLTDNQQSIDELMKQIGAKYPGTGDPPKGSASGANAEERAYEEKQRLLLKTADMVAKMNGKIKDETSTAFEATSLKLADEVEHMRGELDKSAIDFKKYEMDVSGVYAKITEYQDAMAAKIERKRMQSFYGVIADTGVITAGLSGDSSLQAEAEYQKEMTRIKAERQNDDVFKKIAKNEEDIAARIAADKYYAEQEATALKNRNDKFRDANIQKFNEAVQHSNMLTVLEGKTQAEIDNLNYKTLQNEISYLDDQLRTAKLTKDERLKLEKEKYEAMLRLEQIAGRDSRQAVGIALRQLSREYTDWADVAKQSIKTIDSSFENNLANILSGAETFSGGMKNIFSDMVNEISRMMAKMWYEQMLMAPVRSWWSGVLGGLFSGGGQTSTPGVNSYYLSQVADKYTNNSTLSFISGTRATGGPVTAGRMYQVNELGMETFVPNVNGYIMTANQTKQALSSPSQSSNITVNVVNQTGVPATAEVSKQFNGEETVLTIVMSALATNKMGLRDNIQAVAAKGAAYGY